MSRQRFTVELKHFEEPQECLFPADGLRTHLYRPSVDQDGKTSVARAARATIGIVILPITGGNYDVSIMFAEDLVRAGFTVLRCERRAEWLFSEGDGNGEALEPKDIARLGEQYLLDVARAIEWFAENGGVDPDRIGMLGISLGAIFSSRVAAVNPRIKAAVLLIGGAGLPGILASADDREIKQYRAALAARHGVSEAELAPLFEEALTSLDNEAYVSTLDPRTTLMVSGMFDAVVRPRFARRLWEAAHRPRHRRLPCGHYSTVVFVPLIKAWSRSFFVKTLCAPDRAPQ